MADATSLMPPNPGLSATLLSRKPGWEFNSPKGPENVNITPLIDVRVDFLRPPQKSVVRFKH